MRMLRTMIVLGLAGLAFVKGREALAAKLPAAKARVGKARERIEPVLRKATSAVRDVSKDAAELVRDTSRSTAETADAVANAADSVAKAVADSPTAGPFGAPRMDPTRATSQSG